MGAWLMSIAAVVALSVLLDIIVPEGETNKYIKGIFAIITIFVIIAPVTALLNEDFSIADLIDGVSNNTEITTDAALIKKTAEVMKEVKEKFAEKVLEQNGYNNVDVRIYLDYVNEIDFVTADINKLRIDEEEPHININNEIQSIVSGCLCIEGERVVIYGSYTG
jgi:stage III sporulation protein AF